ncbi:MAG: phasin family protein [Steroidobacteraceae bacterium]|nr:phasin family protein [Steroidobacteraceae bacterium]MCC7199889.1 phasin family protein [Gammaproteobacteria bacterium]
MTTQPIDVSVFVEASKKAFAPAARFNELYVKSFERVARQQYAFMGEMLDFAVKQAQLTTTAKDVNELTAKQVELNTAFAEKATQHSQDFVKFATESQAEMTKLFDQAAAEIVPAAKKKAA